MSLMRAKAAERSDLPRLHRIHVQAPHLANIIGLQRTGRNEFGQLLPVFKGLFKIAQVPITKSQIVIGGAYPMSCPYLLKLGAGTFKQRDGLIVA